MERTTIKAVEKTLLIDDFENVIPVCAYCRVSTDKNDQKSSLEAQKQYFNHFFEKHKNWSMRKIFADNGISGTSLENREEFKKMLKECENGKYRIILTKEVSRFSRNIQNTLDIVEELSKIGVYIYFISDDIYTEDEFSKVREALSAAAQQAEAESRKTSRRVRWGHQQKAREGVTFGRKEMYGYRIERDETGKQEYIIVEEEAAVVKKVFEMYASGFGTFKIARWLENNNIPTFRYKKWTNTVILRMLRNEKYVGDLKTNKTYTVDYLSHKKKANQGEVDQYYFKNHHKGIIDQKTWLIVQDLLEKNTTSEEMKQKHSNRFWCSGKIICGECGSKYVSRHKILKNGENYKAWVCFEAQNHGLPKENGQGCIGKCVNDKILKQAMFDIITQIIRPNLQILLPVEKNKHKKINRNGEAEAIDKKISQLTDWLVDGIIDQRRYIEQKERLERKLEEIKRQESNETNIIIQQEQLERLKNIITLSDDEINENIYSILLNKIVVFQGNVLEFHIIGLKAPIILKWSTNGKRNNNYNAIFEVLESR